MLRCAIKKLIILNLRCLLLQASWNFKVFQGLGAFWVMWPYTMQQHNSSSENLQCQAQDTQTVTYFNTNTFLAPTIMAAQLALQEKSSRGEYVVIGAHEFSAAVMAPVAAVGDAMFWGGLRPLAALSAMLLALNGAILAPMAVLVLFTLPSILIRLGGSVAGYVRDAQVVALIQQLRLADVAVVIKQANVVLLGAITAILAVKLNGEMSLSDAASVPSMLLVLALLWVCVFLLKRRLPVVVVLGLVLISMYAAAGMN